MKFPVHPCFCVLSVAFLIPNVWGQTMSVDWLQPVRDVNDRFFLFDDSSSVVGEVALNTVVGFPIEVGEMAKYDGSRWQAAGNVPLATSGDRTVQGFRVRVAPFGGIPNWSLSVDVSLGGDWYFAVGSLYRDGTASHGPLQLIASDGSGPLPVEFLGTSGWNGGAGALVGGLDWDASINELSPQAGNNGESGLAFFRVRDFGNSGSNFTVNVPSGFAAGPAGDDVVFAIGRAIPESSVISLWALLGLYLWQRKRV